MIQEVIELVLVRIWVVNLQIQPEDYKATEWNASDGRGGVGKRYLTLLNTRITELQSIVLDQTVQYNILL